MPQCNPVKIVLSKDIYCLVPTLDQQDFLVGIQTFPRSVISAVCILVAAVDYFALVTITHAAAT